MLKSRNLSILSSLLALFASRSWNTVAFQPVTAGSNPVQKANLQNAAACHWSFSTKLFREPSKWDNLVDEDDEEELLPAPPDMKYVPRNVMRQHQNFFDIREAGGKEMTNDIYVPEPNSDIFWFVGKIARVSDVTVEQAVARQWPLIEQHAANLRPIELFPSRGHLELWVAPGDSEMEVAYNKPDLKFIKMEKEAEGAAAIKSNRIGFQGEIYEKGAGMGFRSCRKPNGSPAKEEIQGPDVPAPGVEDDTEYSEEKYRAPTEEELKKLQETLKEKNMDISDLYEQQQQREGNSD